MWVRSQTKHARGASQAQQLSGKDMDVSMGAVAVDRQASEQPLLWHLQGEIAKCAQAGDWDAVGAISGAIMALTKGKVKGKGQFGKGRASIRATRRVPARRARASMATAIIAMGTDIGRPKASSWTGRCPQRKSQGKG